MPPIDHAHIPPDGAGLSEPLSTFLSRLGNADFVPRLQCVYGRPDILWLHVVSDAMIAASYYSIPLALLYFVRKRRDLAFNWMFVMFAAFILACGTTHIMGILAFWAPMYRLDGVIKLGTGLISIVTAAALWPLIPKAIALPSPTQLRVANDQLAAEVRVREAAEAELRTLYAEMERRVVERTAQLESANARLHAELAERQKAERHKAFLLAELDHRVKNNLATVIALLDESLSAAPSPGEFRESFTGRVRALSAVHSALAASRWEGVGIKELAELAVRAYCHADPSRVTLEGPDVRLSSKAAGSLCMAFNELATNAGKYGAFSVPAGRVAVRWAVEPARGARAPRLTIEWAESGGPPVSPPRRRGLGTRLIEDGLAFELGGSVVNDFRLSGLRCLIDLPLDARTTGRGPLERAAETGHAPGTTS
jgi:two-component sensor histidine kinase